MFTLYRKPGTPLHSFYSLGKYPKELKNHDRITIAKPGLAATLTDRNARAQDEINIKPHTH